jgi:hypothetical protein
MTVSEYVKSWIRKHQQTSNRSAVEGKQTKVSGEEGIREDQPNSVNAMSVICSQTTVSGEGGIREDWAHTAKGKQTTVREYVEAGRLENQPPSINAICVYTAQVYKARINTDPEKRATIRIQSSSGLTFVLHTAFHSTRMISSLR